MADSWSSVQIATLAVSALTPIAVAGLGVFLARASRRLDETMYANRVLFSEQLFQAYRHFMLTLFAMWTNTDADAPLRAPIEAAWGNRRNMQWWDDSMTALFSSTDPSSTDDIQDAYEALSERFRADLYVTHQAPLMTT